MGRMVKGWRGILRKVKVMKTFILVCALMSPILCSAQKDSINVELSPEESLHIQRGLYRGFFALMMQDIEEREYTQAFEKLKILFTHIPHIIKDEKDQEEMCNLLLVFFFKLIVSQIK